MRDDSDISEDNYVREVGKGRFIAEFVPISIVATLLIFCFWTLYVIVLYIVIGKDFSIVDYLLNDSVFAKPKVPLLLASIFFLYEGCRLYWLVKKRVFALFTEEKVVIDQERHSFLWSQIQAVALEGNRKLTIQYEKKGKRKKRGVDLRWLPKKEDFIHKLKESCSAKSIPFYERELTFFSKIKVKMGFLL